jgi:hypothetical protein
MQEGDSRYFAAEPVSKTLSVTPANQVISFSTINNVNELVGSFNLIATSSSGLPVAFTTPDTDKIKITNNTATILAPGKVTISALQEGNINYIAANQINQKICINPQKPSFTSSGLGTETVTLVSSSFNGNQWYKNDQPINGQVSNGLSINTNGVYKLKVTIDGCSSEFSDPFTFLITEVEDRETVSSFKIYPNPVRNELTIQLPKASTQETSELSIFDQTGRLMINERIRGKEQVIPVDQLSPGSYLIRVSNEKQFVYRRFIKQ